MIPLTEIRLIEFPLDDRQYGVPPSLMIACLGSSLTDGAIGLAHAVEISLN